MNRALQKLQVDFPGRLKEQIDAMDPATAGASKHQGDDAPELLVDGEAAQHAKDTAHKHSRGSIEDPTSAPIDSDSDDLEPITRRGTQAMMDDQDRSELVRIATVLSRRRSSIATHPIPTISLGDIDENAPAFNPEHRDFDLEKWLRRFMEQLGEEGISEKCVGVSYRNLDVFGSGEALQLQDTVGSMVAAPLKLGEFFSFNKKEHKQILHSFDGFLRPGELLIVLGRPGSGCSTLLKTICGELEGLNIGEQTKIHYSGIPQKQMIHEFKGETVYNQEVSCVLLSMSKCLGIRMLTNTFPRLTNTSPI